MLLHLLGPTLSALSGGERSVSLFGTWNYIFPAKSSCSRPQECPAQSTAPWKRTSPLVLNWGGNCAREKVASVPASQPLRDHQGTEISPRCLLSESPTAYACWIHSALPLSKCVCHLPAAGTRRSQHLWTLTGALLQGGRSEKGRWMTPGLRLPFNLWIRATHYSHIITFSFFKPSLFCQTLVFICNLDWVWFVICLFYSFSDR